MLDFSTAILLVLQQKKKNKKNTASIKNCQHLIIIVIMSLRPFTENSI